MEILQVIGIALVSASLLTLIRRARPDFAMPVSLAAGVLLFLLVADKLVAVFVLLEDLSSLARLDISYLTTVMKVIGVAYLAEFGAQVCKDADEGALGARVEFAGKVVVLLLTVPVVRAIMQAVLTIMA